MKNLTRLTLVALAGLSVTATAALARGPAGERPSFEMLDRDGNGEITREEMAEMRAARFAAADANGDGALDADELNAAAADRANARTERMIQRLDANDDGKLSPDEMRAPRGAGRMFQRLDTDASGTISKAEFDAGRERAKARRSGAAAAD